MKKSNAKERISREVDEVIWGGGIVPGTDNIKYVFVAGCNVYKTKRDQKKSEGFEIFEILDSFRTIRRHDLHAIMRNSNIETNPFIDLECDHSRLKLRHPFTNNSGELIDIVPSIDDANRIILEKTREIVKRGFTGYEKIPIREVPNGGAWASQYI
jgi:hypothetical protein